MQANGHPNLKPNGQHSQERKVGKNKVTPLDGIAEVVLSSWQSRPSYWKEPAKEHKTRNRHTMQSAAGNPRVTRRSFMYN